MLKNASRIGCVLGLLIASPASSHGASWEFAAIEARFICERMAVGKNWQLSALALGWEQDPQLAERYSASVIDGEGILAEGGRIHSVYKKQSEHIVSYVSDEASRACMFRAPAASSMPAQIGWEKLFGVPPEMIKNQSKFGAMELASFKASSEPRPTMAQFIPIAAIKGDDLLAGLTVMYEFEKEND